MIDKNLVWYFGFGSNVHKQRFLCYIKGGIAEGNSTDYEGCRDQTLPQRDKPFCIENELYFSKSAPKWSGGGIAFIRTDQSKGIKTMGRLYLITRQQLEDVAKQETSSNDFLTINFDEAISNGHTIFKTPSWYGNALHLGQEDDIPIFTLTNERNLPAFTKPSPEYITTIAKGLVETYDIDKQEAIDYFINKQGIANNYTVQEITTIIDKIYQ